MRKLHQSTLLLVSAAIGLSIGFFHHPTLMLIADSIIDTFMRLLKLISMPLIFLAVFSTISGMGSLHTAKKIGGTLLKYTLTTTLIASATALIIYLLINPAGQVIITENTSTSIQQINFPSYLKTLVPDNILQPFLQGNPVSLLFIAFSGGIAVLLLPDQQRDSAHKALNITFAIMMNITRLLLKCLPVVIFGFFAQFAANLPGKEQFNGLILFLTCVLTANMTQALLVLPAILLWKRLSPRRVFQAMKPALLLAFLSKSSCASLPLAIENMENRLNIAPRISRFILPLCITVNMNACAAFILTTTLFVSMSYGITFNFWELVGWIFMSTITAIGNAGVPMGCFMLSSAILVSMNVPLHLMGIILPFYAIIDMLESGINVWSDACVTTIVAKEHNAIAESSPDNSAQIT